MKPKLPNNCRLTSTGCVEVTEGGYTHKVILYKGRVRCFTPGYPLDLPYSAPKEVVRFLLDTEDGSGS